jgi:hypothetical protein
MKTLFARLAGLNRRTKVLLAVAGAMIIIVVACVVLVLAQRSLTQVIRALSGAATEDVYPPNWTIGENNTYVLTPMHNPVQVLAYDKWDPNKVGIWPWDENSPGNRTWYFVPAPEAAGYFRIHTFEISSEGDESYHFLDVYEASTAAGAGVIAYRNIGGDNQLWKLTLLDSDKGLYQIESKISGLCLNIRGDGSAEQQNCDGNQLSQVWALTRR